MFEFEMMEKVTDIVTGFSGHIICRAEYSHGGPNQYLLTCMDITARPVEWWVPEPRLVRANG